MMNADTFGPADEQRKIWNICLYIVLLVLAVPICIVSIVLWLSAHPVFDKDILLASKLCAGIGAAVLVLLLTLFRRWIRAYHASLKYAIDADGVKAEGGVYWRRKVAVPYSKVTHVDVTQGPLQRKYGLSTIHVQTAGAGGTQAAQAELTIEGQKDPEQVKNSILARIKA